MSNHPILASLLVGLGILGHLAMLLLGRLINPLYMLMSAYSVVAPISVSEDFPLTYPAKYARIYITLLIVAIGVFFLKAWKLRLTSIAFMAFVTFYTLAGLWSDLPLAAIQYKGLWAASVLGGILLASSTRDPDAFHVGMRVMVLGSAVFAAIMLYHLLLNPGALNYVGRFSPWGMNPNRVGQTSAPMIIMASYVALYDRRLAWKFMAYGTAFVLSVAVLYTASRGAIGMAVIGCFIVAIPLLKRPLLLAVVLAVAAGSLYAIAELVHVESAERLTDLSLDTRDAPWHDAMVYFRDAPVFGQGWVFQTETRLSGSTENLHSIYFQVLAETGIFGLVLMFASIGIAGIRGLQAYYITVRERFAVPMTYFALAITGAVLAHGLFESGSITGTTLGAVLLGFGFGLFDRVPEMLQAHRAMESGMPHDEAEDPHGQQPTSEWLAESSEGSYA